MTISTPTQIGSFLSTLNVLTSGGIALSAGAATGSLVFVPVVAGSASAGLGISDSKSNTWNSITTATAASGSALQTTIFYSVITSALTTSDTITVTRTPTGGLSAWVNVVTGVDTGTPIDNGGTTGTGNSVTAVTALSTSALASVTTGSLIVEVAGIGIGYGTITPGSGYTVLQSGDSTGGSNPRGGAVQYQLAGSGGSFTPSLSISSGKAYAAASVAFLASAGGSSASGTAALTLSGSGPATALAPSSTASLTLTGSGTAIAHPSTLMIGDSLTFRADSGTVNSREATWRSRVAAAGYPSTSIFWHGVGGKSMVGTDSSGTTTLQDIAAAITQLGQPIDIGVIALGTNDSGSSDVTFTADLNAVLDACVGKITRLHWINLSYYSRANTNAVHFNPILQAQIGLRSFAAYHDYNTYIHDLTDISGTADPTYWLPADSPHMTTAGYALRDAYILGVMASDAAGTASLTLTGTGTAQAAATATAALTLTGSGAARATGAGAGALTLTGAGQGATPATATGAITLTGTATAVPLGGAAGTAALALTGAGTAPAVGAGSASLTLTGSGTAKAAALAAAVLTLTASGTATATGAPIYGAMSSTPGSDQPAMAFATATGPTMSGG